MMSMDEITSATILDKALLVCLYCMSFKHLPLDLDCSTWRSSLERLRRFDLIDDNSEVTERGKVLCEAVRGLGMPVHSWIMPEEQK